MNERSDILVVELLSFLNHFCYRNHHAKFKINRKINRNNRKTYLNKRIQLTIIEDGPTLIIENKGYILYKIFCDNPSILMMIDLNLTTLLSMT